MARKTKLKVYRTPIGFHDAYVAAPSQKAALEAWGSDANLFTRGSAELVTDTELTSEPLAAPGKIIKRLRGSAQEHIAALPSDRSKAKRAVGSEDDEPTPPRPRSRKAPKAIKPSEPPPPRPSRAELDRAEKDLEDLLSRQRQEDADLRRREDEIKRERDRLELQHERERVLAERTVERERAKHSKALATWGGTRAGSS